MVNLMLCESIKEAEVNNYSEWYFQDKKDGCRILIKCNGEEVNIIGRSGINYNKQFADLVKVFQELKLNAVFDGEVICGGDFSKTESRIHTDNQFKLDLLIKEYPAKVYIFDLIELNNTSFANKKLKERLEVLKALNISNSLISIVECILDKQKAINDKIGEGLVIKNPDSVYEFKRSKNWVKLKWTKSKDITFNKFSKNPAGIRCEESQEIKDIAVQVSGKQSEVAESYFELYGYCIVECNYLEITKAGKLRQPTTKAVKSPLCENCDKEVGFEGIIDNDSGELLCEACNRGKYGEDIDFAYERLREERDFK